jgi:LPS export ABC transporter protein LptC
MIRRPIMILVGCVMLVVSACKEEIAPPVAAQPVLGDSADQLIFGMRVALASKGIRRADMDADTAFIYDVGNRIELKRVNTTFFTASGAKDAVLTSREGTYDARLQQLEGRGDVVIVSVDGRRLASPQLLYDQGRNEVSSDTSFVFTEPGRTVRGIGFVSDPNLRNLRILRGYQGTINTAGGR